MSETVDDRKPSVLQQAGGVPGLIYASVPGIVFVVADAVTGLHAATALAVGAGAGVALLRPWWRPSRRDSWCRTGCTSWTPRGGSRSPGSPWDIRSAPSRSSSWCGGCDERIGGWRCGVRAGFRRNTWTAYSYAAGAGLKVPTDPVDRTTSQLIALLFASRAGESRSPLLTPATIWCARRVAVGGDVRPRRVRRVQVLHQLQGGRRGVCTGLGDRVARGVGDQLSMRPQWCGAVVHAGFGGQELGDCLPRSVFVDECPDDVEDDRVNLIGDQRGAFHGIHSSRGGP